MIEQTYDAQRRYGRLVIYARMSSDRQNPRSPETQIDGVKQIIEQQKYPWRIIKTYRDDAVKARYTRRPGLDAMLRDIELRIIRPDLIAVDTWERLGRREEFDELRRKLKIEHGVLVVTADTNFADPTGAIGAAVNSMQSMRASEETRIKSHNVGRGKRDTVKRRRWAGGPVPFGCRLKEIVDSSGPETQVYNVLEHDPETIWIRRIVIEKAHATGWAGTRLAKWLNQHPGIPHHMRRFVPETVSGWLDDDINIGMYTWGKTNTDIHNNSRAIQLNPNASTIVRVGEYVEPIVDVELHEAVKAMKAQRQAIARRTREAKQEKSEEKLIKPIFEGMTLVYRLRGLVCCGCRAAMTVLTSGRTSKAGQRYRYWTCWRRNGGTCSNAQHLREELLREAVTDELRRRFQLPASGAIALPSWHPHVIADLRAACERRRAEQPRNLLDSRERIAQLEQHLEGWSLTLAQPKLPAGVRSDITHRYDAASEEIEHLKSEIAAEEALDEHLKTMLEPHRVVERLGWLRTALDDQNVARSNIILHHHVEKITVHEDGCVVMRGTYAGLFPGAVELLSEPQKIEQAEQADIAAQQKGEKVRPRRRARRRVYDLVGDDYVTPDHAYHAQDPYRLAGLAESLMWETTLFIQPRLCWYQEHADEVYKQWKRQGNLAEMARQYGKTVPTVRKARDLGQQRAGERGEEV